MSLYCASLAKNVLIRTYKNTCMPFPKISQTGMVALHSGLPRSGMVLSTCA